MAGLPDAVVLLDPLIKISESRQIIEVKLIFREGNLLPSLLLYLQKLLIHLKNGTFPLFFPKMPPVQTLKLFFLLIRVGDKFSGELIFQPCMEHLIEHVDFSLNGNRGIVFPVSADHIFIHEKHAVFLDPDLLRRDCPLLVLLAKSLKLMEPVVASLHPGFPFFRIQSLDPMKTRIPVLIEKADKQLLHRHLRNTVDIQIRKNTGNIIEQDPVTSDDIEILRTKSVLVIVENVGNPVHGHRSFSGTGHSLNDDVCLR